MKKETRFSAKCERFIKLLLQLLPLIIIFVFFISFIGFYSSDNLSSFNYNDVPFSDFLATLFQDFYFNLLEYFTFNIWYDVFGFSDLFYSSFVGLFGIDNNDITNLFSFIFCYMGYLVLVEIIWLFKNVLMFLPKIGNYFISKWSGD